MHGAGLHAGYRRSAPAAPPNTTTEEKMESRDIYVKLTDPTGKHKPVVNHHRVWDADRFIASQHKQYDTDAKPGEKRIVSQASKSDYSVSRDSRTERQRRINRRRGR